MKVESIKRGEVQIHLLEWGKLRPNQAGGFSRFLPQEEQEIFQTLDWENQGGEFLWSRLLTGCLTAQYLQVEIGALKMTRGAFGKPFLKDSKLQFNLSHTGRWVALSWSLGPVGIDIEMIPSGEKEKKRQEWLIERHFSKAEREYLNAQPEETKARVFVQIFTLKEAAVKALGTGLRIPLNSFSIPLPLQEKTQREGLEFFNQILSPSGLCLSHAAEKPDGGFLQYKVLHWNEDALVNELTTHQAWNPRLHEKVF